MLRSGLIFGGVALVLGIGAAVISPLCAPCVAVILGFGAGYLAGSTERPLTSQDGWQRGAGAGAIAGAFIVVGQLIAGVINAATLGPTGARAFTEPFGLPPAEPGVVWAAQMAVACCLGMLSVVLMAGAGAGGSSLWFQRHASDRPAEPIPPGL